MSKLDKDIVKSALQDDDDRIVCAALRVINWPKSEYSYLEKFIDGASPEVVAHIILALGKNFYKHNKGLIIKCISRFPMNERILHSVVAVTPKNFLSNNEFELINESFYKPEIEEQKLKKWVDRWQNFVLSE